MSQVIDANNTSVAPLAEVTKSRPNLENSLNNVSSGHKSPSTSSSKKSKKNKNHNSHNNHGSSTDHEQSTHLVQQHSAAPQLSAPKNTHHKDYIRPWSTMTTQELAQWAKETGLDQEEEGTAQPSRRRLPKNTQVRTTTTTVPNTPVASHPASAAPQQSNNYTGALSAGNSPIYAQPTANGAAAFPRFLTYAPSQSNGGSPTMMMQASTSFEQAASSLQQTFSNGSYGIGRSSTPPEEYLPQQQQAPAMMEENVYVVSVRQNDPYAFNVIADTTIAATTVGTTGVTAPGNYFFSQTGSNSVMNASVDSEGTVGYVNSAEVSPVKAGQSEVSYSSPMTFTAYPQRRIEAEEGMNRSTTEPTARKQHRVYVNGRPVIKA